MDNRAVPLENTEVSTQDLSATEESSSLIMVQLPSGRIGKKRAYDIN